MKIAIKLDSWVWCLASNKDLWQSWVKKAICYLSKCIPYFLKYTDSVFPFLCECRDLDNDCCFIYFQKTKSRSISEVFLYTYFYSKSINLKSKKISCAFNTNSMCHISARLQSSSIQPIIVFSPVFNIVEQSSSLIKQVIFYHEVVDSNYERQINVDVLKKTLSASKLRIKWNICTL